MSVSATVIVAITAVAASTGTVDAIEVESLVGDWGFEVGAEGSILGCHLHRRSGCKRGCVFGKKLGALGALWELFGSSSQLRILERYETYHPKICQILQILPGE